MRKPFLILLGSLVLASLSASDKAIERVRFEQKLGQALPLASTFRNEAGRDVPLAAFFNEKPVILVLAYYECPNLCTIVLNGLGTGLQGLRNVPGQDFEVVVVSINPGESFERAAAKKRTYARRYGRAAEGWHFLTGSESAIAKLSKAAGYHYYYDEASDQYAHPSGIVIAGPRGRISRYLLGIEFPPGKLDQALKAAAAERSGPLARDLFLLCFHYDPQTGRYSLAIVRLVQAACLLSVGGLVGGILFLTRRPAKKP